MSDRELVEDIFAHIMTATQRIERRYEKTILALKQHKEEPASRYE